MTSKISYIPLPTDEVRSVQAGGPDAYGCLPERVISDGSGNPCRHCLDFIPAGADMMILSWRPFSSFQPYAETGPIFLHADKCKSWTGTGVPPILTASPDYLVKGYTADQRICYGTGKIVAADEIAAYAADLLNREDISFADVRSARNNCFQVRIVRDQA